MKTNKIEEEEIKSKKVRKYLRGMLLAIVVLESASNNRHSSENQADRLSLASTRGLVSLDSEEVIL